MTYAASTDVAADRSIAEIKRTVQRYGASQFAYLESEGHVAVAFVMLGYQVRIAVPLPTREEFARSPTGRPRAATSITNAHQQAVKQRWRALALVVKAKLEAVEAGIVTFEEEFAMHMVLPNGQKVSEAVLPAVHQAMVNGGPMRLQIGASGAE